jgi:hypothetical protein
MIRDGWISANGSTGSGGRSRHLQAEPLILIEFNELTPALMFRFMAAGLLPHFQRFHDESEVYITDAEEEGENLNPWVQWVTIHSGLSAEQHGIKRLSDGHRLEVKAIWDTLSDAGYRVWVCGSMNARYDKPLHGFLLPDPWSSGLTPFPAEEFERYYAFVQDQVQEHTNKGRRLSKLGVLRFFTYMLTHGLSLSTVGAIIRQLVGERRGTGHWKRASLMDRLQWDVFAHYYRKCRPHLSTFFLNSTAHYQHSYWRNMDPESFAVRPPEEENREYGGAILYGYLQMDLLLGRFLRLARQNATLLFCTGLSQQPYLKAEATGGRHYYRLIGPQVLVEPIGIPDRFEYNPVMSDQALLQFADEESCGRAEEVLQSYRLLDGPGFWCQRTGTSMMVQCHWTKTIPDDAELVQEGSGRRVPFFKVFYSMDVLKSGFHHPDGMLWVRRPSRHHVVHSQKLPITLIAPMVFEHFGMAVPERMPMGAVSPGESPWPNAPGFNGAAPPAYALGPVGR